MIIAIHGKKQAGKDTIGKIIQFLTSDYYRPNRGEKYDEDYTLLDSYSDFCDYTIIDYEHKFKIKKFAEKLKKVVSILTGIHVAYMEEEEIKNKILPEMFWVYKVPRYKDKDTILSYLSYKDRFEGDMLIKPTLRYYLQYIGTDLLREQLHPDIWINTLMRDYKKNDNWIITDMRFENELYAVKERKGITIKVKRNIDITDNHKSEKELSDFWFDYIIENNGNIEELIEKVNKILIKEKIF